MGITLASNLWENYRTTAVAFHTASPNLSPTDLDTQFDLLTKQCLTLQTDESHRRLAVTLLEMAMEDYQACGGQVIRAELA